MATAGGAADVVMTTSFGVAHLTHLDVASREVDIEGHAVALPLQAADAVPLL